VRGLVYNASDFVFGTDASMESPFASGLDIPIGLCLGPGGDLYVSEGGDDEITVITAGGGFSGAAPFAFGFQTPTQMSCSESEILVGSVFQDAVVDATAGGDVSAGPFVATGFLTPSGLFRDSTGQLWLSDSGREKIFDISGGGDFSQAPGFFEGGEPRGIAEFDGRLLVADQDAGRIIDFSDGGSSATSPTFATLPDIRGLLHVPGGFLLAATGTAIYNVTAGGDFTGATPIVSGFGGLDGAMVYVAGCGDGLVQPDLGEECDDANDIQGDGCSSTCQQSLCEPAPVSGCLEAARASLAIVERKAGNEKWKARLRGFDAETIPASFGDPVTDDTVYGLCLYDAKENLAGDLFVDRAGQSCGPRQQSCWKSSPKGLSYKDADAAADGVKKIVLRTGAAGKGKVQLQAGNKRKKGQDALPVGVAQNLESQGRARLQLITQGGDGECFDATLVDVKRSDGVQFKAKTP